MFLGKDAVEHDTKRGGPAVVGVSVLAVTTKAITMTMALNRRYCSSVILRFFFCNRFFHPFTARHHHLVFVPQMS